MHLPFVVVFTDRPPFSSPTGSGAAASAHQRGSKKIRETSIDSREMAGLTVILETHKSHHPYHRGHYHTTAAKEQPHILVKASMLRQHYLAHSPPQPLPTMPSSPFLQSCYLCRGHLSHEKDIYMYRGDRAFCSVECRRNQILMDEEGLGGEKTNSNNVAAPTCVSHHRKGAIKNRATARGGFAY